MKLGKVACGTVAAFGMAAFSLVAFAADTDHAAEIQKWREAREKKLRADNGWLTLAGRFPLRPGANTFGTGKSNDVVFPAQLAGTGPERLGTLVVDTLEMKVILKLAEGVTMTSDGKSFAGERVMGTVAGKRDWVTLGRISMYVIEREGSFILRLADNESLVRKNFPGCLWYASDEKFRVEAKFVPYPEGKTLPIVNVIDEVSQEPCPGYIEFQIDGKPFQLDAIAEGDSLFFVFKDETAGDTTYPPSRFLTIEQRPKPGVPFVLDFNKAYNPPCSFSEFTTCPLPPKQNVLKVRIEAGEKYRKGA
jgi:uncharacterized protein (DUF1684 family)